MTGPIPFTTHPRRVVHVADGTRALVAIRRHRHRRTTPWNHPLDIPRLAAFLVRRLRGDRSWRVELFHGDDDLGALPLREPDRVWVVPDRAAAVARAEALCVDLRRGVTGGGRGA